MYDIGTYYKWNNWHFEVEGLYKRYAHDSFQDVWAVDAFVNYDWFIQKKKFPFKKISFLARFDYMAITVTVRLMRTVRCISPIMNASVLPVV